MKEVTVSAETGLSWISHIYQPDIIMYNFQIPGHGIAVGYGYLYSSHRR